LEISKHNFCNNLKFTTSKNPNIQDITNPNITISPFYELRQATQNNPIVLADEQIADEHIDYYVMDRVREGQWITIESNEGIEYTRQIGYCNMVYMEVSSLKF
jgi:hypothetical protein